MGHKVRVLCTSNKSEIPIPGAFVQNFRRPRSVFSISPLLLKALRQFQPNILHFHSGFIPRNTSLAKWARRHSLPYAVTPNGNCSVKLFQRRLVLKLPYWYLFEKPYLDRAAFIQAVGDRKQIEHLNIQAPIIDALNGIDQKALPPCKPSSLILKRLPHWRNRKIFIFIGRLDVQQKGLDLLMPGFARAVQNGLNGCLLFVGPNWENGRNMLENLQRTLNLGERVFFWGGAYGDEKFDLLSEADFFLHTSRWEGMSFSVMEALAYDKICMVSAPADPGGLIAKYSAGRLTELSPDAISDGLQTLAGMPEISLETMRHNAKRLVNQELDWRKITKTIVNAYETFGNMP